jgi:hypothetical protein
LKQNYFRNPWAIISVIAAAILSHSSCLGLLSQLFSHC